MQEDKASKLREQEIVDRYVQQEPNHGLKKFTSVQWSSSRASTIVQECAVEADLPQYIDDEDKDEEEEKRLFFDAVQEYNATIDSKDRINVCTNTIHNIGEVIDLIRISQEKYKLRDKDGFWGKIRRAFKKLGSHDKSGGDWMKLLPQDSYYISIICGGLMIILRAASSLKGLNKEITNAICAVPDILEKKKRLAAVYKSSSRLTELNSVLYVRILQMMGIILKYYQQSSAKRVTKALAQQSSFGKDLLKRVNAIYQCSDNIEKEANLCAHEQGKRLEQASRKMSDQMDEMQPIIQVLKKVFIASPILRRIARIEVSPSPASQPPCAKSYPHTGEAKFHRKSRKRQLLSHLNQNKAAIRDDVLNNLVSVLSLSLESQDRAVYTMQSAELQNWLNCTVSSVLLVNGNEPNAIYNGSALSFVVAKLAEAGRETGINTRSTTGELAMIELHFFCDGRRNSRDDVDNSPAQLIKSLIAQLVLQYGPLDFTYVKPMKYVDVHDVEILLEIFDELLLQLPPTLIVLCILDDLSCYDDDQRGEDAEKLLQQLLSYARQCDEESCTFKLFLTAPLHLRLPSAEQLDEDEVFLIPQNVPRGGGFGDLEWDLRVERDVDGNAEALKEVEL